MYDFEEKKTLVVKEKYFNIKQSKIGKNVLVFNGHYCKKFNKEFLHIFSFQNLLRFFCFADASIKNSIFLRIPLPVDSVLSRGTALGKTPGI